MPPYYETVPEDIQGQANENRLVNVGLTAYPEPYLSKLKLQEDITLNNLVFNKIDANNVVWIVSDIDGWWNVPDPEIPDLPRGWGDGSYGAVGRWAARDMTLTGSFLVQDPSQVEVARNTLIEACDMVKAGGWLIVDEPSTSKAAYVRLSGRPSIQTVNARGRTDFSIGLRAVDPIKYEWIDGNEDGYDYVDIDSGNTGTVTNSGNVAVPLVFEISGALTSTSSNTTAIINTTSSDQIDIISTLDSDQTLEIDTYNREILLVDGATITNGRSKAAILIDWIYAAPGNNIISFEDTSNGASTATCRVYWRSGWIG